ncbi:MAG TPA: TolC family protein [Bryobacterales bacterium]|nr:TolC family protein [Bryobacterales bacterium]
MKDRVSLSLALVFVACGAAVAQPPQKLTLQQAEAIAAKNHPQVSAALLAALAANQVTTEVRSAFFPNLYGSVSGAGAINDSRIAAGLLNNPSVYNRFAAGFAVDQLVTDFGRTRNLTASASLRAQAQQETVEATHAQVLVQVDRAYFAALRAQSVLRVAQQTVAARQLIVDQVTALAQSQLKSQLDVSFAAVNLAEAKLLLLSAQNEIKSTSADLSAALGYRDQQTFDLAEEPLPGSAPSDLDQLVAGALRDRPELISARYSHEGAIRFADAEKDLLRPTISAVGVAGGIPAHAAQLSDRYSAVGVNVNIPVFNGHLFTARRAEADLRAQQAEQEIRNLENNIARDVKVAWLNANTAFQRLSLTAELLQQASLALELAQTRYELGLGSIVELSQAQLNKTSAEIAAAGAKYEYQIERSVLNYQIGALH